MIVSVIISSTISLSLTFLYLHQVEGYIGIKAVFITLTEVGKLRDNYIYYNPQLIMIFNYWYYSNYSA